MNIKLNKMTGSSKMLVNIPLSLRAVQVICFIFFLSFTISSIPIKAYADDACFLWVSGLPGSDHRNIETGNQDAEVIFDKIGTNGEFPSPNSPNWRGVPAGSNTVIAPGDYPDVLGTPSQRGPFFLASHGSLDSIAIGSGTRVVIYEGLNYSGPVVFDRTGPLLINSYDVRETNDWSASGSLFAQFTPSVRYTANSFFGNQYGLWKLSGLTLNDLIGNSAPNPSPSGFGPKSLKVTCTSATPSTPGQCSSTNVNACVSGTFQDEPDTTTQDRWTCLGSGGGGNAGCSASKALPGGACGFASGNTYSSAPQSASSLCSFGTASAVSGRGPWNWTCTASGGTANCSSAICSPPVNGSCNNASRNACASGTSGNPSETSTNYTWDCNGAHGGSTASCSMVKPTGCIVGNEFEINDWDGWQGEGFNPSAPEGGPCVVSQYMAPQNRFAGGNWQDCTDTGSNPSTAKSNGPHANTVQAGKCISRVWYNGGSYRNATQCKVFGYECGGGSSSVNGSCSNTLNTCNSGTFFDLTDMTGQHTWRCDGSNGGSSPTCSLNKPTVNGQCNNSSLNGCSSGIFADRSDDSNNYYWTCNGENGGANDNCAMRKPPTPVAGVCNNSTRNACNAGTLANAGENSTAFTWNCNGSNGGANVSCSMAKPTNQCPMSGYCSGTAFATTSILNPDSSLKTWDDAVSYCTSQGATCCERRTPTGFPATSGGIFAYRSSNFVSQFNLGVTACNVTPSIAQPVLACTSFIQKSCSGEAITRVALGAIAVQGTTLPPASASEISACKAMGGTCIQAEVVLNRPDTGYTGLYKLFCHRGKATSDFEMVNRSGTFACD